MTALRLAKKGWGGADPEKVMQMSARWVTEIVQYEDFLDDYDKAYVELNRKK